MDREMHDLAAELRQMPPSEGAEWLVKHFPLESEQWGKALILLDRARFPKKEAQQLARYYLARAPYASDRPYRVFAKLLGVEGLLKVLGDILPQLRPRADLLLYHLKPLLAGSANEADRLAATDFVTSLSTAE